MQFRNGGTETEIDKVVQKGGAKKKKLKAAKGALFSVPATQLETIASDPDVEFIAKDRTVRTMLDKAAGTVGADLAGASGSSASESGSLLLTAALTLSTI